MTTNQEGRQAAIRDSTSTAYGVAADWNALFDDAGISAGTFNERLLAWINAELSASYSNLVSAMQAYAEDAGYDGWEDMATLVLAMNGAETLLYGETQGLAFDFTDQSALIIDTGTPANNYDSTGIVSSGSLVGPSGKLTYTSPSNKLTMQADGYIKYQAHNLVTYSNEFENAIYFDVNSSQTDNSATDSRGEMLAATILGAGSQWGFAVLGVTFISGAKYRIAFEIKPKAGDCDDWLKLVAPNGTSAWVDITNATVGTLQSEFDSVTVASLGSGWLFVEAIITAAANSAYYLQSVSSNEANSTINTTGTFYITRMHCSLYPCETDYIATAGAAKYALPIEYDTSGNCLGLLVEEQRTNLCLYSNDLTQAGSWTASNMTTAKTATGPDNVANSATTITATAGNATVTQAITSASAARVTSVFIKRRTGTGNIDLTQDNGSTWTTQAVDSTWTRFSLSSVTSANPTVGIRIVTSGDAVDVALFSHEVGSFPTSPILTYGAAATRAADPLSQLSTTFPLSATAGSLYAYVAPYAGADLAGIVSLNDGTGNEEIVIYKDASANIVAQVEDGGVGQLDPLDSTVNASSGTAFKVALAWAANDFALSVDGTAVQTDPGGTLPTVTTLEIGVDQANNYFNGHIKAISYVPRRKSNAELQAETA